VPETIQDVLMARIDRLAEAPRRVLQTASVLGREVPLRLLEAVWAEPVALDEQLHELQSLEFVYQMAGAEPGFVFKHALTQDVAYETLLEGRRRELHAAAGRALETLYSDRLDEVYDRLDGAGVRGAPQHAGDHPRGDPARRLRGGRRRAPRAAA
jgi:predicted ATPase